MRILAIESSAVTASVAILEDDTLTDTSSNDR